MDENKRIKLLNIDYHVRPCCAMCRHAEFKPGRLGIRWLQRWGSCQLHEYKHLKHTGPPKKLSINLFGHCHDFSLNKDSLAELGNYGLFWWL